MKLLIILTLLTFALVACAPATGPVTCPACGHDFDTADTGK